MGKRRWRPMGLVAAVAVAVGASASCSDPPASPVDQAGATTVTTVLPAAPTTTFASTTTSAPDSCASAPFAAPAPTSPAPASLVAAVDDALFAPTWGALDVSASVWVEGYGEVASRAPDVALLPASNQKLFTAMGARLLLAQDLVFITEVRRSGADLVLVAGGDPTLTRAGPHSLEALARQVRDSGVVGPVTVAVDARHFESATTAAGWQDWQVPTYVGPMSALIVADNRFRSDPGYVADPAIGNAEEFAAHLRRVGVAVDGAVRVATTPAVGDLVASVSSAPVGELLGEMLRRSDNEIAESLLREVGGGSTAAGVAAIGAALDAWCLDLAGTSGDGSGLSREDFRSAGEWVRLLRAASAQPWGDALRADLPVAGQTGTLAGRLTGPLTAGNVRAKTGTIIGGQALSGYATAVSGRQIVFSVVVNGDPGAVAGVTSAIDAVVAAAVRHG